MAVSAAVPLTEEERIVRWRWDCAVALGYPPDQATLISLDHEVDLHDLERLIAAGCPPDVALRIA